MHTYAVLLRGINVGGKNTIPMTQLKDCLGRLGYSSVSTYIASGNVILKTDQRPKQVRIRIERALPTRFQLDSDLIRALVLTPNQLRDVIANKPRGFGEQPEKYHSDAIFLMGLDSAQAMTAFNPREGVDRVWPGNGVVYSQRLSSLRAKSRLNRVLATPEYKFMTIRSWNTTTRLYDLVKSVEAGSKKSAPQELRRGRKPTSHTSRSKHPRR
jgi:uncharacterized protein (DUF1697 family)